MTVKPGITITGTDERGRQVTIELSADDITRYHELVEMLADMLRSRVNGNSEL